MEADRIKWNQRFGSRESYHGVPPSPFLAQEIERIQRLAPGGLALDIACGEGRNSIFLAKHGFRVTGLDISDVGIARGIKRARASGLEVDFQRTDLDGYKIAGKFDLIINFNFLLRELIIQEIAALTPGGLLLFDTILESPQLLETRKANYLLRHGELRQLFEVFDGEILFEEEITGLEFPTARLFFRKQDQG